MAAIALFIVHRSLSRVPHALIWSAAFAATAIRWAIIGLFGTGAAEFPSDGLGVSPLGVVPILLLAEGVRMRARAKSMRWVVPAAAAIAIPVQLIAYFVPNVPMRATLIPLLAGLLICWTVALVAPRDRRISLTEFTVMLILVLLAGIELGGAALTILEQTGLVPPRGAYAILFAVTLQPICAALGMSTLLLIAFDFSAEQQRLINTDPLTGVLNRQGFKQAARVAMDRRRRPRPMSIALSDLDGFKGVNDRHGHAAGDEALAGFARYLASSLERDEVVGRFGGEEFAVLLPGSDGAQAFARIEAMRADLASLTIPNLPDLEVRASFGIAQHLPGEALDSLIERADEALYRSKREGRDRSTLASPAAP
ncbi:diguanylate cyclase [Sphingomonas sp. MMS24-J13]|uniref:GGDEF domain-containing protein n=1 Tax=Sphingomonas sp. MMS24-J13 TaxID=3238686 RepID=UPI00384D4700